MMVGLIFIYRENLFNMKIEIYYQTIEVITKNKCSKRRLLNKFPDLQFKNQPNITILESIAIENLLIICANKNI